MSIIIEEFNEKFKIKDLTIYESEYWVWSLRPVQSTLGAGVLSLKRECESLGRVKEEEFSDLSNMIKLIEKALKSLFEYDKINYLMLMMVDKHVHYHVIPRYARVIEFYGNKWSDEGWPGIPVLSGNISNVEELYYILNQLRKILMD